MTTRQGVLEGGTGAELGGPHSAQGGERADRLKSHILSPTSLDAVPMTTATSGAAWEVTQRMRRRDPDVYGEPSQRRHGTRPIAKLPLSFTHTCTHTHQ